MMLTCCANFQLFCDWKYVDFQTGHYADFELFKVDIHFSKFEQVKIDPICSLLYADFRHVSYFTEFGQDVPQKTIQKIQEPQI